MKKYVKITSAAVIILLMLQIIFPVIANIEFDTSYAATEYTYGGVTYTYNGTNTLTITGSGTVTSNWKTSSTLNASKEKITTIKFNSANITAIGSNAFSDCTALTTITYTKHSITSIQNNAFSNCTSLVTVTIPNTVTTIGSSAFSGCTKLVTLTIGTGVTSIGANAFSNAPLTTKITYNAINCMTYNDAFKNKQTKTVEIGTKVTQLPNYFISGNTTVTAVTIPASCTSIGSYAFSGCTGIKTVSIPKTVQKILDHAFYNCSALTTLKLSGSAGYASNNCVLYGDYSFYNTGITSVVGIAPDAIVGTNAFPSSVTITKSTYLGVNTPHTGDATSRALTATREVYLKQGSKIQFSYGYGGCTSEGHDDTTGSFTAVIIDSSGKEKTILKKLNSNKRVDGEISTSIEELELQEGNYTIKFTFSGVFNGQGCDAAGYSRIANFGVSSTVKYSGNGATGGSTESQIKEYNKDLTLRQNGYTRTGYTFQNWNTNGSGTGTTYYAGGTYSNNEDLTLYAQWKINTSTLKVDPNGGSWNNLTNVASFTEKYNTKMNIPIPIKEGYAFTGWTRTNQYGSLSSTTTDTTYTFGEANGVTDTITANWKIAYQLVIEPNGGIWEESSENQSTTLIERETKEIEFPRRNGYRFAGWILKGTGSSIDLTEENKDIFTMGNEDAVITADWQLITHDIEGKIIWDDQEGKYNSRPSQVEVTLTSDEEITEEGVLKTPTTQTVTGETYKFENVQSNKVKDNTNYEYRVSQNKVPGYETQINQYTITNHLILPNYTSEIRMEPFDKFESELAQNEPVLLVGTIMAAKDNREKIGLAKEEVNFQIDKGIKIEEDSIRITYIDKEGNQKEITEYTIENNIIKATFESNREQDSTAGDRVIIVAKGILQEMKEYTNRISYAGYLRDYETGEDTNINLGIVTTANDIVKPQKVSITIKEVNEENEITTGSYFEIRKKATGEVIQNFMTKGKLEAIRKLEPMVEYVAVETKPIPGYTTAEEATFMVNENGEIVIQNGAEKEGNTVVIRDYKTRLQVEVKDEQTKEYIVGPTWQIIKKAEKNGEIVEEILTEWTSEGKPVLIEKLPIGEYTLREVSIGKETGYATIEDITFSIQDTKELQILEVEQKISRVRVHLKDVETEEYVEGAVLQIIKQIEKDGKVEEKVVREWTTKEGGDLELKLPVGDYIIREIKLPEHSVYATIEDKKITIMDTLEEQQVELKQGVTKIRIEIIDEETKEKIDNVEVEIIDKETGEVIKLKETEEGYEAERVPIGEYIIREKTPDGYKELEQTEVKVEDTRETQTKKVENKHLIYDMQVEKELVSITIDGEKKVVSKGEIQKVEIKESKIKTADIRLEYVIRVSNVGETRATIGSIIDHIPEGFKLLSTDWKQEGRNAIYNAEKEELKPNECKEVSIVLKWENDASNFGEKKNTAELKGSTNPYGYEDKTTDNNIGEEITIFSIKTGLEDKNSRIQIVTIILAASIVISFIAGVEIVFLKRK